MKQRTVFVFLVLSIFNLYSQKIVSLERFAKVNFSTIKYKSEYTDVLGHPFVKDSFRMGKILNTSGELASSVKIKFDIYSKQLLVETDDSILIPDMSLVEAFEMDSIDSGGAEYYKRIFYKNNSAYYQILEKGSVFLYLLKTKSIKSSVKREFVNSESFYISINNGSFQKLKLNKKGIINAFPNNHYYLELYIQSHQLNINKLNDLRKLVAYYNRLK